MRTIETMNEKQYPTIELKSATDLFARTFRGRRSSYATSISFGLVCGKQSTRLWAAAMSAAFCWSNLQESAIAIAPPILPVVVFGQTAPAHSEKQENNPPAPAGGNEAPKNEPKAGGVQIDPELQKRIDEMVANDPNAKANEDVKKQQEEARKPSRKTRASGQVDPRLVPPARAGNLLENQPAVDPALLPGATISPTPSGPSTPINIPATLDSNTGVPPEQRKYTFSMKDSPYPVLIEAVARQTGLAIMGEAPQDGKVSFVTDQELTFDQMLGRVRMLLFQYKPHDPYWLRRHPTHLEVARVTDLYRVHPRDRMYRNVDEFRAANLTDEELALVIYEPKGSIADLREIRNFLPDYVRVTPMEGNRLAIFALVSDINKYLGLIDFFAAKGSDPRTLERIPVEFILPSEALTKLQSLMALDSVPKAGMPNPRGGRQAEPNPLDNMPEPTVNYLADDAQKVLIVRAMQDKIDEIKRLLPLIDVDTSPEQRPPVIIELKHAEANELIGTIQQVLAMSPSGAGGAPTNAPGPAAAAPGAPKRKRTGRTPATTGAPGASTSGDITMFPHPSLHAIVVMASEPDVDRVRHLVSVFDVPSEVGPIRIELEHIEASEAISSLAEILFGGSAGDPTAQRARMVADSSGRSFWYSGTQNDLVMVRELLVTLDVPMEPSVLHVAELKFQKPTFVMNMLKSYDEGVAAPPPAPGGAKSPKKKRASAVQVGPAMPTAAGSKFTPDDENNRLYVLCTDSEWAVYLPLIEQLDSIGESKNPVFVRVALQHITPEAAIEKLVSLLPPGDSPAGKLRYAPAPGGDLLVFNATPEEMKRIQVIVAEIDQHSDIEERTFIIRYADPSEVETALHTLVGGAPQTPIKTRKLKGGGDLPESLIPFGGPANPLFAVVRIGNRLVVKASPETMKRIAEVIAELDVAESELRVYDGFPLNADLDSLADKLSMMLGGSGLGQSPPGKRGAVADTSTAPTFIPQSGSGRLLVVAPPHLFPKIEDFLEVLRRGVNDLDPVIVEFIPLQYADPEMLAITLEPLLSMKVRRMIDSGQLNDGAGEPPATLQQAQKRRTQPTGQSERYHLEPDIANKRIAIAATKMIVDEARTLIAELDRPGASGEPVNRTVRVRSDAANIASAVREMLGGPSRRQASALRKKGEAAPAPFTGVPDNTPVVTVTEIPGGGALILRGLPKDVDEAERWIQEIDREAGHDRVVKVYQIQHANITKLVDLIMNVADSPPKPKIIGGGKKPPAAGGGRDGSDSSVDLDLEEPSFELVETRIGAEVYIQADTITNTMIVAASPPKIAQIDGIVAQFDTRETDLEDEPPIPKFIYDLKHAKAIDAEFDLEALLEAFWEPRKELPSVDDAPFGEALIIRYPHEDRFDEIRELIAQYIDVPKKGEQDTKIKTFAPPTGINAKEAALWFKMQHPELDIEIVDVTTVQEDDYGVEQIKPVSPEKVNPCVLPNSMAPPTVVHAAFASSLLLQQEPEEEQPPVEEEEYDPTIDAAVQSFLPVGTESGQSPSTTDSSSGNGDKDKDAIRPGEKLKIRVDNVGGTIATEGSKGLIDKIPKWIKDLEDELKNFPTRPDIRVVRVRYIDLETAVNILEETFNATRQQTAQLQQMQAMQRQQMQAAMMQQRMQQQQQQQQGKGPEGQPGQGGRGGADPRQAAAEMAQQQMQMQMPQLPPTTVRITPNPRDRTLILRADTSQYPEIFKLLSIIDQPQPFESEFRTFPLQKLNAGDVEALLKEMLGLDQQAGAARRRPTAPGVPGAAAMGAASSASGSSGLPVPILQPTTTGTKPLGVDPKDIKITSNADANTIIAMAPSAALDYIEKLIKDLESQNVPDRKSKHYTLKHADVSEASEYLTRHFEEGGSAARASGRTTRPGGAGDRSAGAAGGTRPLNMPSFVAFPRLNLLSVQATEEQFVDIDELVAMLDVPSDEDEYQTVKLTHADAKVVAETLTAMFGAAGTGAVRGGGARGGAPAQTAIGGTTGPKFIGEEGGRLLFFSAAQGMHERIHEVIGELEAQSRVTATPRIIKLEHAVASDVADAIDAAYCGGGGRRAAGGARGARTAAPSTGGTANRGRFTITAHDPTKQLFVVADDDMFAQIESLAGTLDTPQKLEFEFRIYPLQFANARAIHTTMNKLVTDYIRMMPDKSQAPPFSVDVDDKANALIVLGGPVVFGFVEDALKTVDIAANKQSPPGFFLVALKNADAQEVAGNITRIWSARKDVPAGETPPVVEANRATNTLIVRGTQAQIDEIKKGVIDPVEEQSTTALLTETIQLKFAQPEVVAESVTRIFNEKRTAFQNVGSQPGGGRPIPPSEMNVVVTPDVSTNQLIVQASEKNMAFIKDRVAALDKQEIAGDSVTTSKIYVMKNADPTAVANIVKEWARTRQPGGGTQQRLVSQRDTVMAVAEPSTQSLVVTASESNHKLIGEMIEGLDGDATSAGLKRLLHTIKLTSANCEEVARSLQEVNRGRATAAGRGQGTLQITAEPGTNSLLILASTTEMEELRPLIEGLDKEPVSATQQQVHVVNLSNADSAAVATTLNEVFVRSAPRQQGSQGPPISISALTGSRAILVKCKAEDFARIDAAIKELDSEDVSVAEEVRVVPILYGDATEMQTALQEYLRKPGSAAGGGGRGGANLAGDVRVSVLAQGNAVVISGDKEQVGELEATIKAMDQVGEKGALPQLLVLKHARVAQIMPSLDEMFVDQRGARGGRNQNPPVITAVDAINGLVIRATPTDFAAIEATVQKLDTEEISFAEPVKIIQVAQGINVTDLGEKVELAINEGAMALAGGTRRGDIPQITVTPDLRTNSLIVSGSPTKFEDAEKLTRAMEKLGPTSGTTVIPLSTKNIDVDEIQRLIDMLTDQGTGGGGSGARRSGTTRPSAPRPSGAGTSRPASQPRQAQPPRTPPSRPAQSTPRR